MIEINRVFGTDQLETDMDFEYKKIKFQNNCDKKSHSIKWKDSSRRVNNAGLLWLVNSLWFCYNR
jgi:hypothetical protein